MRAGGEVFNNGAKALELEGGEIGVKVVVKNTKSVVIVNEVNKMDAAVRNNLVVYNGGGLEGVKSNIGFGNADNTTAATTTANVARRAKSGEK